MKSQQTKKAPHAANIAGHLAALLSHQEKHNLVERRLAELDEAIAASEAELAKSNIPNVDHLLERRADLLADLAIGVASLADIDAIDTQIATETKAIAATVKSAGQRVANANQALQGLRRKRDQSAQELQELNTATPDVVLDAILGEMELVCEEYVGAAFALREQFLRLTALERMSKRFQRPGMRRAGVDAVPGDVVFAVPLIKLPQCEAHANKFNLSRGVLLSNEPRYDDFIPQQIDQAITAEIKRLADVGVMRYVV